MTLGDDILRVASKVKSGATSFTHDEVEAVFKGYDYWVAKAVTNNSTTTKCCAEVTILKAKLASVADIIDYALKAVDDGAVNKEVFTVLLHNIKSTL